MKEVKEGTVISGDPVRATGRAQIGLGTNRGAVRILGPQKPLRWASSNVPFNKCEDRDPENKSDLQRVT